MIKERYPYINNPYGFKLPEPKPVIHPTINKWDEFTEVDKNILQTIKSKLVEEIGECKMKVFGSRVKGNWDEESDYDIMVYQKVSPEIMLKIHKYDWIDVKVDVQFSSPDYITDLLSVEIP